MQPQQAMPTIEPKVRPGTQTTWAEKERPQRPHRLILYNDEVNSFEHVIRSLVEVLSHEWAQAEQCAMLAHWKQKVAVKEGDPASLRRYQQALTDRYLTVEIE